MYHVCKPLVLALLLGFGTPTDLPAEPKRIIEPFAKRLYGGGKHSAQYWGHELIGPFDDSRYGLDDPRVPTFWVYTVTDIDYRFDESNGRISALESGQASLRSDLDVRIQAALNSVDQRIVSEEVRRDIEATLRAAMEETIKRYEAQISASLEQRVAQEVKRQLDSLAKDN